MRTSTMPWNMTRTQYQPYVLSVLIGLKLFGGLHIPDTTTSCDRGPASRPDGKSRLATIATSATVDSRAYFRISFPPLVFRCGLYSIASYRLFHLLTV